MRAFRIFLALAAAGATFYSLNVLAVQNGYRDRLDFRNRHYHEHDCGPGQKAMLSIITGTTPQAILNLNQKGLKESSP